MSTEQELAGLLTKARNFFKLKADAPTEAVVACLDVSLEDTVASIVNTQMNGDSVKALISAVVTSSISANNFAKKDEITSLQTTVDTVNNRMASIEKAVLDTDADGKPIIKQGAEKFSLEDAIEMELGVRTVSNPTKY